jgi:putative nucleotidyltransferase with HDIG domain
MHRYLRPRALFYGAEVALLAAALAAAALTYHPQDWHPVGLTLLLAGLTLLGDRLTIQAAGQHVSAAFIALALAMALLGPAPALLIGVVMCLVAAVIEKASWSTLLNNVTTYATFLVAGALVIRALGTNVHSNLHDARGATFALEVFGVFLVTNLLNFILIALDKRVIHGRSLLAQTQQLLVPILPGQFAAAILAAMLAAAYTSFGYAALVGLVIVILIFQYLAIALMKSEDRAELLAAHSNRLATLQLGVLVTLVETLQLRDPSTARHAAAVARYARALAQEMGCSERDQDLVHSAGLLHDIGKFALPDRILHATELSEEDWGLVRRHPQEGATLVGRLDGYGPVADVILYQHERIDGAGYPAGLIGNEIPLLSRVLAVCDVYDVLTARDSYRTPRTPQEAIVEIRKSAGRQLDADVVERFISKLERDGPVTAADGDEAVFEAELDFERRARALAQPAT